MRDDDIIGTADWRKITDTQSPPYSMQGRLVATFSYKGKEFPKSGSGTLVSPRHVLTAAHNLYHANAGKAIQAYFYAGQNGTDTVFGEVVVNRMQIPERWDSKRDPAWDFALITLAKPVGETAGFMDLQAVGDATLKASLLTLAGYPKKYGNTLWSHQDKPIGVTDDFLKYVIDTEEGQSGSGLWLELGNSRYTVIGVHTQGSLNPSKPDFNMGVRITEEKLKVIRSWMKSD